MAVNTTIETYNLSKYYDGKPAVDNLNVSFPEGRVTGLLGPNGSGKSTLLKMMVGLVRPDSGNVSIFGSKPSWATNAEISYLPDRGRWYPSHTVEHALCYSSRIYPRFNMKMALEMMNFMRLDPKTKVESLSKGHQACLMLTLCLARETRLVLLDEPFTGIDLVSREIIIQSIIDSFSERKQTFILCTHEIYEAESLFDYVVFLNGGRLLKAEEAENLRAQDGSVESNYRRLFT